MKDKLIAVCCTAFLGGCVTNEPLTPLQQSVNDIAYLETTVEQCAIHVGFDGLSRINQQAQTLRQKANMLGATDAEIESAKGRMRTGFAISSGMKGQIPTCGDFMSGSSNIVARNM